MSAKLETPGTNVNSVPSETKSPRVILIPIDGSSHSDRAFRWYLHNFKQPDDQVKFVDIIEPLYTTTAVGMAMEHSPMVEMSRTMEECIESGRKLCQSCLDKCKHVNMNCQAFLHVDNRPGAALVRAVTEHKADVVVMGNRGIGTIRRTFLGSVSDYVLHHAQVPVVIVPPDKD